MRKVNKVLTISGWRFAARRGMRPPMPAPRNPRSLGILFAILPIAGAIGIGLLGQPVIGMVGGLVLAAVLCTIFWLVDRRR